jgi:hypothetical protein
LTDPSRPHQVNGYHPTVDPIARALGGLETGQHIILHRLDRQDRALAEIHDQMTDGRHVHQDLTIRVTALEKRPASSLPSLSAADFKLTLTAIGVLVLVLLGKAEMALQLLGIGGK